MKLKNQYTKAHYDLICQQFDEGNYDKIKGIFTFVKNVCKQLNKEDSSIDEVLDVDFIITRLQNKSYNQQELLNLFDYMFTIIRNIQSSQHDEELEKFTKENPDVAALFLTMAKKESKASARRTRKKNGRTRRVTHRRQKEKAEAELIKMHPDFIEIRQDDTFITGQKNNLNGYRMLCMKT